MHRPRLLLEYADEPCPACEHVHGYARTYRCVGCDRGVCAACAIVIRATSEVFCPQCREVGGEAI